MFDFQEKIFSDEFVEIFYLPFLIVTCTSFLLFVKLVGVRYTLLSLKWTMLYRYWSNLGRPLRYKDLPTSDRTSGQLIFCCYRNSGRRGNEWWSSVSLALWAAMVSSLWHVHSRSPLIFLKEGGVLAVAFSVTIWLGRDM